MFLFNHRGFFTARLVLTLALLAGLFGVTPVSQVYAATLIVPDNYRTIQAAINAASPGDTISVRSGTYSENLTLSKYVILTAASYTSLDPTRNTTIIDGSRSRSKPAILISPGISPMPTIRGFIIRNGIDNVKVTSEAIIEHNYFIGSTDQLDYAAGGGGIARRNVFFDSRDDAIDLDNMTRPLLIEHNRLMYNRDDGIEVRLQDATAPAVPITITIRKNEIIGCDEDGIQFIDYGQTVNTNRNYVITDNVIANCRFAGIGLMGNAISVEDYSGADVVEAIWAYNNTIYGNDYGISGGDNLIAHNNIIANSLTKGVWRVQGPAGASSVVAYSLFYNNGVDADQSTLGAGNKFGQNPLFASAPNPGPDGVWRTVDDDFRGLALQSGSPAINAGYDPSCPGTDLLGASRPQGSHCDMGAFEFTGTGPAPTPTPPPVTRVGPGLYDDTNGNWLYSGSWTTYTSSGPANNTLHYTDAAGSYAELLFNGSGFTLTFTKYSNRGSIDVYVDGVKITTINANSPSLQWQQTYTSPGLTAGNHTVRLVHAGGGTYIDVDAIQIYGAPVIAGTYDDTNSNWAYSGVWAVYNNSGPANNTLHFTSTVSNAATIAFYGTRFQLTFTKHTNRGSIDVFVDGVKITTINANSPSLQWQQTYISPIYSAGNHIVRLVHAGGEYIDIDAIQIFGAPVTAGIYEDTNINWLYGGSWTTYTGSGPTNNTLHFTGTTGDYAELLFTGTNFTLTYTKHTNRGSIDVYVDGVKIDTINANSASLAWQQTYTSPTLAAGTHTLRLVHAGSGGTYIDVDVIQIYAPVTYDDTHAAWQYSGVWTPFAGSGPYNNTLRYTDGVGNYAELLFTGTRFTLTFTRHTNRGSIDVYVDGAKLTTINANSSALQWQQTYTSPILASGNHAVRLVHAGGGTYIDVDAITILP